MRAVNLWLQRALFSALAILRCPVIRNRCGSKHDNMKAVCALLISAGMNECSLLWKIRRHESHQQTRGALRITVTNSHVFLQRIACTRTNENICTRVQIIKRHNFSADSWSRTVLYTMWQDLYLAAQKMAARTAFQGILHSLVFLVLFHLLPLPSDWTIRRHWRWCSR